MRIRTPILMALVLVVGVALAPLILPLLASSGGAVSAQVSGTPTTVPATPTPASGTPIPSPLATAPPTATPDPATQPDRCEPNDSLTQPCALPTEIDNADLTVVDGREDVFSFLLKGGRTYTILARSTTGIDPLIRLFRAEDTSTVTAENDDVQSGTTDAQVTVTTTRDGWYLVEVVNKAPGDMRGRTYILSARSATSPATATTATTATPDAQTPMTPGGDLYENNYSPETAGTLAWGVPYDLSLICPVPGQCPGGDHDFFWLPIKAGVPLVAVTYDLGPGADPALTIYRPDAGSTDPATGMVGWRWWAGNDDVIPGYTLRAQALIIPDWSGYALLVVASSERRDPPPLPPAAGPLGRYRLMVGPPSLAPMQAVLRAQTDIPAAPPTVAPTFAPTGQPATAPVAPAPARDTREVIKETGAGGIAVVVQTTPLYAAAPPTEQDVLATYPEGAQVRLLGQTYAGWVKVLPADSVTPGWMFGPHLRLRDTAGGAAGTVPDGSGTPPADGTVIPTPGTRPDGSPAIPGGGEPSRDGVPQVVVQPPLPTPTAVHAPPVSRSVTIEVCAVAKAQDRACTRPLERMRVEVVRVSDGRVLFVGLTDRTGRVSPSIQIAPDTAVDLQIGALGIRTALPANGAIVPVRVVEATP